LADKLPLERVFPGWKDEHGVVHIVGLHTNTRIMTECRYVIVNTGNVWVQVEKYDPCYEPPNCLECIVNFEEF
jgi:hypothetical protein